MSTEAIGAAAPETTIVMDVEQPAAAGASKSTGLHSPPDSNNAMNLDGSDSELSDLEELADKLNGTVDGMTIDVDADHELDLDNVPEPVPQPDTTPVPAVVDEVEDIGEITPAEWSGTVPVFRPTMKQFKDFKLFVCWPNYPPATGWRGCCALFCLLT